MGAARGGRRRQLQRAGPGMARRHCFAHPGAWGITLPPARLVDRAHGMHPIVRIALVGLVSWQAVAAAVALVRRSSTCPGLSSLTATTPERLQAALGADARLLIELQRLVPPGVVVLNQQVVGTLDDLIRTTKDEGELRAAFERLSARNGLFIQMTVLLYPTPFLLSVPAPIPLAEQEAAAGRERWLFVLQDDPEPRDRAGWECVHRDPRFSLWRFQKAS